jgi:predicted secreted hydrolase
MVKRSLLLRWALGGALLLGVGLLLRGALTLAAPGTGAEGPRATLSAAEALAGSGVEGFARALEPRPFVFPEDHGPHPGYRTEWWYLTGHLEAEDGRAFAFQVTFFRNALAPEVEVEAEAEADPEAEGPTSAWATNQLWMAHAAVTDVTAGAHVHAERIARGAVGLAGATADPFRVWLEDWSFEGVAPGSAFPFRVRVGIDGTPVELALRVEEGKDPVLQGDRGLSQKGPEPGNASYYLSWTRMPLSGTLRLAEGEAPVAVRGEGWMDREWSTSALGSMHVGWDWFQVQLDDGRDLMFFELRRDDGLPDPLNHGALVEADGSFRPLGAGEVELEVTGRWASPVDGAEYPSGWIVRIPGEEIELTLTPLVADQEMRVSFRYWEGGLEVSGTAAGVPVRGRGFAELTGYAEAGGRAPS